MAENVTNELLLEHMKRFQASLDTLTGEIQQLKIRQMETHTAVLGLRRDQATDAEVSAHLQAQLDAVTERLYRIERRLELNE